MVFKQCHDKCWRAGNQTRYNYELQLLQYNFHTMPQLLHLLLYKLTLHV